MPDIKEQVQAYINSAAVDGKATHTVTPSSEEGSPVIKFRVEGLRPAPEPEQPEHGNANFIEPQGLAKIHTQDTADVYRIMNAAAKVIPFGEQRLAIQAKVEGGAATVSIDTSKVDPGKLAAVSERAETVMVR